MTLEDIEHFAEFTGDTFYAHMDEEAAAANPFFGGRVAHGYLVVSWAAGLFVDPDPGPVLANYGLDNLRFLTPVKPGDELTVTLTCKQITPRGDAEHGEVRWDADVVNQKGEPVATLRRPDAGRQDLAAGAGVAAGSGDAGWASGRLAKVPRVRRGCGARDLPSTTRRTSAKGGAMAVAVGGSSGRGRQRSGVRAGDRPR